MFRFLFRMWPHFQPVTRSIHNGTGCILNTPATLVGALTPSPVCVSETGGQWAGVNIQSVRNYKRKYYVPSAWKRINKHGIHKRLMTESGVHVLWRRFLKGRHNLAPYERLIPGSTDGKIHPIKPKWKR